MPNRDHLVNSGGNSMKTWLVTFSCILLTGHAAHAQPDATSALPDKAVKMMSKLIGTWTTRGERNGEEIQGIYQAQWNPSRTGLIYSSREGNQFYSGVGYWDGSNEQFVENWTGHSLAVEQRYRENSEEKWAGNGVVYTHDGKRREGSVSVHFSGDAFTFIGDAGEEKLTSITTRVPLEKSEAALQAWADFVVGGTWVSEHESQESRHTYSWRPGEKVLALDRQGGDFPGVSLITIDHDAECVRWYEIDNSGMHGTAIMLPVDKDTWRLLGHYTSKDAVQDLQLTAKRIGSNEIHVDGINVVNGSQEIWKNQVWKRER